MAFLEDHCITSAEQAVATFSLSEVGKTEESVTAKMQSRRGQWKLAVPHGQLMINFTNLKQGAEVLKIPFERITNCNIIMIYIS